MTRHKSGIGVHIGTRKENKGCDKKTQTIDHIKRNEELQEVNIRSNI